MSYTTIDMCVNDVDLQVRVKSAASKEAWVGGPEFSQSIYGERLRTYPEEAIGTFMYAIAIDNEADYEYAINAGQPPDPGKDPGVIPDAKIQAGIQAHWPPDPAIVPNPIPMNPPTPGEPVIVAVPVPPGNGEGA